MLNTVDISEIVWTIMVSWWLASHGDLVEESGGSQEKAVIGSQLSFKWRFFGLAGNARQAAAMLHQSNSRTIVSNPLVWSPLGAVVWAFTGDREMADGCQFQPVVLRSEEPMHWEAINDILKISIWRCWERETIILIFLL